MVIDVHVHPTGYPYVDHSPEADDFRDRVFQRRRDAALASPIAMTGKPSGGNGGGNGGDDQDDGVRGNHRPQRLQGSWNRSWL